MTTKEFKGALSKHKNRLRGSVISISVITAKGIEKLTYTSLGRFGSAILKLEKEGFKFGFVTIGNDLVVKGTKDIKQFKEEIECGVWNNYEFLATSL